MKINYSYFGSRGVAYLTSVRRFLGWPSFALRLLGVILATAPCAASAFQISASAPSHSGLPRQWAPGSSVTLSSSADSTPIGNFLWLHDDAAISGATHASLTLSNLASPDSGNYRLQITTPDGITLLSENTLTVNVLPLPPSPVDPSFTSALDPGFTVRSVGPFAADGSMIVTGHSASGASQVVRLRSDGSLVPTFHFPAATGPILAGFSDGSLIVANPPFRLDANGNALAFTLPESFDSNKPLSAAAVQSDGIFYLAQGKSLVRFFADGRIDSSFAFGNPPETGLPSEAGISKLCLDRLNRLYVNGSGKYLYQSYNDWYRVSANGSRDLTFHWQTAPDNYLTQITPLDDGRIFSASEEKVKSEYNSSTASGGILRDDGTFDPIWTYGPEGFSFVDMIVNRRTSQAYAVGRGGKLHRFNITATGMVEDIQFFAGTTRIFGVTLDPNGRPMIFDSFTQWEGHATSGVARLLPDMPPPFLPLNAAIDHSTVIVPNEPQTFKGSTVTFTSTVTGTGPFTYQWLALDGQPLPADTTSPQLTISNLSRSNLGRYQLRVTGPGGSSVRSNVDPVVIGDPPFLSNLSGRAMIGTGEDTAIAGLTTQTVSSNGVQCLLRGAGPALKPFGVTHFLPNPAIDLFDSSGQLIAHNDHWSANPNVAGAAIAVGAFNFAPASNDAALLQTFPTGQATVVLKNQSGDSGVGLLEIYQLIHYSYDVWGNSRYDSLGQSTNLSFRARTSPGEGTAIAGFIITDPEGFDRPARVLLRAIGPTLSSYGIQHPLTNPILTVYNSNGEVVATNDDWAVNNTSADSMTLSAAMKKVGAFNLTTDSKDSALLLSLPAGAYSMQASGGSGVVLLEVYLVR